MERNCLPKLKFKIVENPLIEYLEGVELRLGQRTDDFLKAQAQGFAENTSDFVPKWNPNLYLSAFEKRYQILFGDESIQGIEVWYTGFTKQAEEGPLPVGVTHEFGDVETGILERDYAEYIESLYHFAEKGIEDFADVYEVNLKRFINEVLKGGA